MHPHRCTVCDAHGYVNVNEDEQEACGQCDGVGYVCVRCGEPSETWFCAGCKDKPAVTVDVVPVPSEEAPF